MEIRGIPASQGIAIGKVYRYEHVELEYDSFYTGSHEVEMLRLERALENVSVNIKELIEKSEERFGPDHAAIFKAHLEILNDPILKWEATQRIEQKQETSEKAFKEVADGYASIFASMEDDYMKERAADVIDIAGQVLQALCGVSEKSLEAITEPVIVIADDLTPSDTAKLNKDLVLGFVTNIGGRTSHSAIMARSLEIPALVGTQRILEAVKDGEWIILDAVKGVVITGPSDQEIQEYELSKEALLLAKEKRKKLVNQSTVTMDGHQVELAANIGAPKDLDKVIKNGGEGIGLYRTEFLYMDESQMPDEEKQFMAYKRVLEEMNPKPVVIRTLDIGGDKQLSYLKMESELNPFLGHRAIRLCLEERDLFRTQIRALLRASRYGNLKIMFPMIATIDEFKEAKAFVLETGQMLKNEGAQISDKIEIGIMVEIPSTAVMAKQFAEVVDFFSIGTNDLIQYTFAADRMNEKVSYLYQPYNPALLMLIQRVIEAAHEAGKWAGMCGEMAGDHLAIPLLVGLGLDEFSMSASSILEARELIGKLSLEDTRKLALEAITLGSNEDVKVLVEKYIATL